LTDNYTLYIAGNLHGRVSLNHNTLTKQKQQIK